MEKNLTSIVVVAAALENCSGAILMHRRPEGRDHAGRWEFPGGKVERGETLREALARELHEESDLRIEPGLFAPVGFVTGQSDPEIALLLFHARIEGGDPVAKEGGVWRWMKRGEIAGLDLAPLDRVLLPGLLAMQGPEGG